MKKILWKIKCFFGRKMFIYIVDDDKLKDDEILLKGHHIYVTRGAIVKLVEGGKKNENS